MILKLDEPLLKYKEKTLVVSFAYKLMHTGKEAAFRRDSEIVRYNLIIPLPDFLPGVKLEPCPNHVIRDGICLPQFRYLPGVVLVNKKKRAAVWGN